MTTWRSRVRLGAYVVLSTITLSGTVAACGSEDPTAESDSPEDADESWDSPLDDYLGGGSFRMAGGAVAVSARREGDEHRDRQVQDDVAACMRDEGFEYVPYIPDQSIADVFEEASSLSPDEFARQYGYGISTLGFGTSDDDEDDPNEAIRDSLSESAAAAYDEALWGSAGGGLVVVESGAADENGDVPDTATSDEREPGCMQKAHEKAYGAENSGLPDMSEFDDMFEDLRALEERITSDPDMASAVDAWSACMAEAGYSGLDSLDAGQVSIMDRMSELFASAEPAGAAGPAESADAGAADAGPTAEPDAEDEGPRMGRLDPTQVDEEALAQLRDDEIATASADRDCRAEHVDAVEQDVRGAMESEFVEANREILERFRDQMAGTAE